MGNFLQPNTRKQLAYRDFGSPGGTPNWASQLLAANQALVLLPCTPARVSYPNQFGLPPSLGFASFRLPEIGIDVP